MVFSDILDPIMSPLLGLDPLLAVTIVALVVSIIVTVIYKYTTNQDLMKRLKTELKELQAEMKQLREHPDQMMKVQKKAMETNMKYMGQSFKSTFYTILPIILIFSWMNAHFAFDPIGPGQQFQLIASFEEEASGIAVVETPEGIEIVGEAEQPIADGEAVFTLRGEEGSYTGEDAPRVSYAGMDYTKDVIIDTERYAPVEQRVSDSKLEELRLSNQKKEILPIIGWGWLGTYIIFSIIFSMSLRKALKVY